MLNARWSSICLSFGVLITALAAFAAKEPTKQSAKLVLHKDWTLQSSCETSATGEEISKPGFRPIAWHHVEVPSTVVGALVSDKTYPQDVFYGMNLRSLPGMNYSTKEFFSNQPMPDGSPFRCSWWFRTEFKLPANDLQKRRWLHFDGINYRANVWINGEKIADAKDVAGAFRIFEFEVSKHLHTGAKPNALAVEVFAPEKKDLGITWVDWNPTPPDKDMGLWKDVYLSTTAAVALRHPFISSKLDSEYKTASLTISADLNNASNRPVKGTLRAEIEGIRVSQPVELGPAEVKTVSFTPEKFPKLILAHPRLWWPYQMGSPQMYNAKLSFESGGQISDSANVSFGVREVTSEITDKGSRLFKINGRKILIRGAAWAADMFLRWSTPERLEADLNYVRDMGLNAIRFEGNLERDQFYEITDRMGILVMPGWTCCDYWEKWAEWEPEQHKIAGASLEDQLRRLRNHPSIFVWLYGSDNPPPPDVEKMYLDILNAQRWPNPAVSSASQAPTTVTGPSGVKMTGPYDYVPPNYWLTDKEAGGAHGFNTETSPGPAIPPIESLKRFIPADHLWPIDEYWNYHAGGERFTTINIFTNGLYERYGKAESLADYLRKSQAMTYEGQRAMFEAYARNKYVSTGVIQWMMKNAWPSLIWHLYDYYLVPAGGYFGTKKACEIVHVQYSYDDNSVAVINGYDRPIPGMKVTAKIYGLDSKEKLSHETTLDLAADSSTRAFELPNVEGLTGTYFLRLQLHDSSGKSVSDNFYWLSTKPDVLDWAKRSDTVYTPQMSFADLTGINGLPNVKLAVQSRMQRKGETGTVRVMLQNPNKDLAFMVHLRLTKGKGGEDIVPVFWEDNYVSLLPGEKLELTGSYNLAISDRTEAVVEVDGWNVAPSTIKSGGKHVSDSK